MFLLLKDTLKEYFSPAMILALPIDVLGEAFQFIESRKNCIFAYFSSTFYTVNPYWKFGKMQFLASRVIRYFFGITFVHVSISGSEKDIFKVL